MAYSNEYSKPHTNGNHGFREDRSHTAAPSDGRFRNSALRAQHNAHTGDRNFRPDSRPPEHRAVPAAPRMPVQPEFGPAAPLRPAEEDVFRIEGRNAVIEAFRAGKGIEKLLIAENLERSSLTPVIAACRDSGTVVVKTDRRHLDELSATGAHQGVIAYLTPCEFVSLDAILARAAELGQAPLIVICDHVEDPHNLGAIIRSAEVAGAHGVIIPRRRSAPITGIAVKASAGAVLHMPICRCANVNAVIAELKEKGVWVWGADGSGKSTIYQTDFSGPSAIVVGSEGSGISRLTASACDGVVSIPMAGKVNSLNVSAAAAVILFEAVRQRTLIAPERS